MVNERANTSNYTGTFTLLQFFFAFRFSNNRFVEKDRKGAKEFPYSVLDLISKNLSRLRAVTNDF